MLTSTLGICEHRLDIHHTRFQHDSVWYRMYWIDAKFTSPELKAAAHLKSHSMGTSLGHAWYFLGHYGLFLVLL